MPALSVSIDGTPIATVSTDGYDVLDVRIHGACVDEQLASLDLAGGSFPEQGESTYLWWIDELPLRTGQVVTVSFLENGPTSQPGKTVEELCDGEPPRTETEAKPRAELFAELRSLPRLREKFCMRLKVSTGIRFAGETRPEEHAFAFGVLWNSFHPERARVSLHSYTLESLEARGPMNYHVQERIHCGDSIEFELIPCMP
jgi:hypothetical protein